MMQVNKVQGSKIFICHKHRAEYNVQRKALLALHRLAFKHLVSPAPS